MARGDEETKTALSVNWNSGTGEVSGCEGCHAAETWDRTIGSVGSERCHLNEPSPDSLTRGLPLPLHPFHSDKLPLHCVGNILLFLDVLPRGIFCIPPSE